MTCARFEEFRRLVLGDRALQQELRQLEDGEAFVVRVVETGAARGFGFTAEDVREAMSAGQRAWLERWLR